MRRLFDPPGLNINLAAALICAAAVPFFSAAALADTSSLPPVLAQLSAFRGRIDYVGVRVGAPVGSVIRGSFIARDGGFELTESINGTTLHADAGGAFLEPSGARVSDALGAPSLANAYLVIAGRIGALGIAPRPSTTADALLPDGTRLYEDAGALHIIGASASTGAHYAFRFDDWSSENGLFLPHAVVRTRDGASDGSFRIGRYHVVRGTPLAAGSSAAAPAPAAPAVDPVAQLIRQRRQLALDRVPDAERPFASLMLLLALCVLGFAWWRRDGWVDKLCSRVAADARGWRTIGRSSFVSADGDLFLDGCRYRVGPEFYARAVSVQVSALLVRVTAPGVGKAVVLPRRLAGLRKGRPLARRATAGMSIIEAFVACVLFALVVVGGVFPAVTAAARADGVAQRAALALTLAKNALDDQASALAYGGTIAPGSVETVINGLRVTTTVSPASSTGVYDIVVRVSDTRGSASAVLGTSIGLPVPTPAPTGAGN